MKLKSKITFYICLTVIIPLIAMCVSIYNKSANILNNESSVLTEVQILRAQEKIDLMVKKVQVETLALSRDEHVHNFFEDTEDVYDVNKYLTRTMEIMNMNNDYYKDLFIVDLRGLIVASTMPNAMYVDLSSRNYIQESFNFERTATSDILCSLADGANIVNIVHPIFNENGKVLGLFGIAIKAENFVNFVKDYKIGESGYFIIIDSNGYILSHKDPHMIQKSAAEVLPGFKNSKIVYNDIYKSYNDGYIYSYIKMNSNNWILLTIMPESDLMAKSISLLKHVVFYSIIISVFAALISIYMSNKISLPITYINNYINKTKNSNDIFENAIDRTLAKNKLEKIHMESSNSIDYFIETVKNKIDKNLNSFDKDAEMLIKKSEFLKNSLDMKTYLTLKFLSTLSHDIRTSLTLIKGYAQGIMSGIIQDEETKKRFITEIYNSAQVLENISNDVLDSTYEAQYDRKPTLMEVNANEFCKYLYNSAKDYIENSDLIFVGEYYVEDCILNIDKVKIIRVWQNILSNAVKYSDKFTEITVTINKENNRLLFKIKDNGRGIKENDKDYIFDMFYKSDLSSTNSYGLGLYVSKLILELHDSKMEFESAINKGSSFWFYLDTYN